MKLSLSVVALAALPLCSAQLHQLARKAGLKYFGSATDSPGQRERAGFEAVYPKYDAILNDKREFGQTTPTNGQKWMFIEPEPGVFNFTEGDIVANIARKNGQLLRCHALVWHSQLAPWVESTTWTPETLRPVIRRHVTKLVEHYKGKCYAWDVVNEALNDDGTYRESVFYKVLGDEYLKIAFEAASKADPKAKLYYNDYGIERPNNKSQGVIRIVKLLKNARIKIDGVGLQAHYRAASTAPTLDQQITVMKSYAALGVELALTELDVRIELPLNQTNVVVQSEVYKNATGACLQVPQCVGITTWDFYDPFSWVQATFPGFGAPLLWFDDFTKHPAYYGIVEALKNKTVRPPCNKRRRMANLD